jgi:hemerythrin
VTPNPTRANWSPAIETGLPEIDAQHRNLFELAASFRGEGDQIRVMRALSMLAEYANTHLRDEEAMLQAIGFAGLEAHREQHRLFRAMLRALLDESRHLSLDQIAMRIEELINGWFYRHILTVDAEYVAAVKAHRASVDGSRG